MVRRILVWVGLLLFVIRFSLDIADSIHAKAELLSGAPGAGAAAMNWMVDVDVWLLNHGLEPLEVAVFLILLFSGWIIPDAWPFVKQRFLKGATGAFNQRFRNLDFVAGRQDFRLGIEKAYTKYCSLNNIHRTNRSLVDLVDAVQFPNEFPPPKDRPISEWMAAAAWEATSKQLIDFLRQLYESVPDAERSGILPPLEYQRFILAHNTTSKFWDDAAREIREGRLTASSIKRQLDSNERDIMLLVMSELVISEIVPWDKGGGKTNLFFLARDKTTLKRQRQWCMPHD
ncbi:MAG: hypothetical protein ACLQJR_17855 [Stellaceae bacterium]